MMRACNLYQVCRGLYGMFRFRVIGCMMGLWCFAAISSSTAWLWDSWDSAGGVQPYHLKHKSKLP